MGAGEICDVDKYMLFHGHNPLKDLYEPDDEMLEYVKEMASINVPSFEGVTFPSIEKKKMKEDAKGFVDSILSFDKIGFLNDERLTKILSATEVNDIQELINVYNESPVFISPFNLPIEYSYNQYFAGLLDTQLLVTDDPKYHKELLPRLNLYFSKIRLSKNVTDITTSCYLHELMHTQLEKNKGVIANYYNSEVLSIFMELLYIYEHNKKEYMFMLSKRIEHVLLSFYSMYLYMSCGEKEDYSQYDFVKDGKYLISIMKAFNLLEKYIASNNKIKREIMGEIQKVINARKNLEEVLYKFEILYDSSMNVEITNKLILK